MSSDNNDFFAQIRRSLDEELSSIDDATADKLYQARRNAMQAYPAKKSSNRSWFVTGSLATTLAVSVLAINLYKQPAIDPGLAQPMVENMLEAEILADADKLPMLKDLDFYLWLEAQQSAV